MNTSVLSAIMLFVLVVIFWLFMSYKGFQRMKNGASEAFKAVTMCYKVRRETALRMAKLMDSHDDVQEKFVHKVSVAVDAAESSESPTEIIAAETEMVQVIGEMAEMAQQYEKLVSGKRYKKIKEELDKDDRNIATTIRIYNTIAKTYNEKVHGIMTRFAAKIFGFKRIPMI